VSARRLILVRHGESVWNVEQRVQGHTCRGLTERGHAQAERVAQALAASARGASIVTSDLGRCRATVAPLATLVGIDPQVDASLRERDFGRWEGLTRDDLERDDPDRYQRWRAGEDVIAEVGGESDAVLRARAGALFRRLLGLSPELEGGSGVAPAPLHDTVIAITHGGTIWYGIHELLGIPGYRLGPVENASVTELVVGGGGPAGLDPAVPRLHRFNGIGHL